MEDSMRQFEVTWLREQVEWHRQSLEAYEKVLRGLVTGAEPVTIRLTLKARRPRNNRDLGEWKTVTVPWWPALPWPEEPIDPAPGFACATVAGMRAMVTSISVFGLRDEALVRAVKLVEEGQRRARNFVPVFLTDSPNQSVFAKRGYVSEYFPASVYRTLKGSLNWARVEARLRLVGRKWSISASIDLSSPNDRPPNRAKSSTVDPNGQVSDELAFGGADDIAAPELKKGNSGSRRRKGLRAASPRVSSSAPPRGKIKRLAEAIRATGLFDEEWYLKTYPDVAHSHADPIIHYLEFGAEQGRNPHPLFHTRFYASQMLRAKRR